MTTTETIKLGRAKNAALSFFEHRLYIPKIYLDTEWNNQPVDVLAIDRDGSGDVHALILIRTAANDAYQEAFDRDLNAALEATLDQFAKVQVHYKYIGIVYESKPEAPLRGLAGTISDRSFAPDGIGRIGFISFNFLDHDQPQPAVLYKPERFRAKVAELADQYVLQHSPDWEIRA